MKFPGGLDIRQMMKQAQAMQEKMAKEMDELHVEASSGGGVVTVVMKGNHEILSLRSIRMLSRTAMWRCSRTWCWRPQTRLTARLTRP